MRFLDTISWRGIRKGNKVIYYVTHDGRILGDSRGYDTAEEASEAAIAAVKAKGTCNGVAFAVYRPGYIKP